MEKRQEAGSKGLVRKGNKAVEINKGKVKNRKNREK